MRLYKVKKWLLGMLSLGIWCTSLPSTVYADSTYAGWANKAGAGSIRYYTGGFTVHRVNYEGTAEEFNKQYGQYLTAQNGNTKGGAVRDKQIGEVNYDNYSIVPFNEGKTNSTKAGLAYVGIQFQDYNYMGKALAMQDGELWKDFFTDQEITYDSEGNVTNKPVIMECNGIIMMLSYDGAIRDQYSLKSPEDGTWFLGGINESTGEFYGHQYTLEAGMIHTSRDEETGGWYWNRDGLLSEKYSDGNNMLQTHLRHRNDDFNQRMHLLYFKSYLPIPTSTDIEPDPDPSIEWETTGEYGRDFPEVYTYNTSDEFNLGQGIPSGESFTNGFLTNKWFGKYGWGKTNVVKKDIKVEHPIEASYQERHEYECEHEDYSHTVVYYTTEYYDVCPTVYTSREAYYYGIRSADIYEFKNADVSNGAYGIPPHYENPSSMPVTMDINESSVSTYETLYATDKDKHIRFYPESGETTRPHSGIVDTGYSQKGDAWFVSHLNLQEQDDNDSGIYVTSHNDRLEINGKVYMDNEEASSHTAGVAPDLKGPESINILNISQNSESGGDFKCVFEEKGVDIPAETRNDKYMTSFTARYVRRTPEDNQLQTIDKSSKEAIYNPYDSNEPVVVHTPVISPVKITDPETETQLFNSPPARISSGEELYKLRLDGTYTLEFQPKQWFSNEFGELLGYENDAMTADRYDKYVKQKLVKFPFPVTIIWPTGNKTYCPLKNDNYTEWVKFPEDMNTLQFYVPTWVTESHTLWGNNNEPGNVYDLKFRVEAQNAEGGMGEDDTEEEELNSLLENHVATYDVYANVSGSIYGFEIVGINDRDMFEGYSNDVNRPVDYSFALNLEEKKASTKNRFGDPYLRYTLTGEVTDRWDERDTLPLRPGSSHRYGSMGTIWKGTKFSFRFKTIANLADANDKIVITPTFRYVDKNTGAVTEQKDISIYYSDTSGNYIEYGDIRDNEKNVKTVQLKDPQFEGSWYQGGNDKKDIGVYSFLSDDLRDALVTRHGNNFVTGINDDLLYTVGAENKRKPYLNKQHKSYSLSKIVLNPDMKILSGNAEEFEKNQKYQKTDGYFDNGNYMIRWSDPTDNTKASVGTFRSSMQTWYGQYQIPDQLFVCKKKIDINGDGTIATLGTVSGQTGYNSGDDINGDGTIDLEDYALTGKLATDSPIWLKTGYLVLNFDIVTYNGGNDEDHKHLVYGGIPASGHLNMWGRGHEDQVDTVKLESSETTENPYSEDNKMANPSHGSFTYTVKDGDIAVISINEKLSDKLQPRLFMIN